MVKEVITFGDTEVKKNKFQHCKNLVLSEDVDNKNMQVSTMVSSGEKINKYFIGYKDDDHKIKPLRIMLWKRSAYVKRYVGETKWMYFLIKDDELLETCNKIWIKVRSSIEKELDCEPINNKKFLKTKIRSYSHEATEFYDNVIPKVHSNYTCLAVTLINFVLRKGESDYPQVF